MFYTRKCLFGYLYLSLSSSSRGPWRCHAKGNEPLFTLDNTKLSLRKPLRHETKTSTISTTITLHIIATMEYESQFVVMMNKITVDGNVTRKQLRKMIRNLTKEHKTSKSIQNGNHKSYRSEQLTFEKHCKFRSASLRVISNSNSKGQQKYSRELDPVTTEAPPTVTTNAPTAELSMRRARIQARATTAIAISIPKKLHAYNTWIS